MKTISEAMKEFNDNEKNPLRNVKKKKVVEEKGMNIAYDCEFNTNNDLELISIGLVREDGKTYYAVSNEFDESKLDDWLKENVIALLPPKEEWKSRETIKKEIVEFCGDSPTFWAYYSSHDHTVLFNLVGGMMKGPKGWPMRTNDLKQMQFHLGIAELPEQKEGHHDALEDAKWNMEVFNFLSKEADKVGVVSDFKAVEKRQKGK